MPDEKSIDEAPGIATAQSYKLVFFSVLDSAKTSLATHEPNFFILREEYKPNQPKPCELCDQFGHEMKECTGAAKEKPVKCGGLKTELETDVKFIFIKLNILREYLANELIMDSLPFPYDFEKLIDDYIFLCTFVGNDFLPPLPSLDIRESAIDRLVQTYKKVLCNTSNYLTENGHVDFSNLQLIMSDLGADEAEVFQKRHKAHLQQLKSRSFKREKQKRMKSSATPSDVETTHQTTSQMGMYGTSANASGNQSSSHERLASILKYDQAESSGSSPTGVKRKLEDCGKDADSDIQPEPEDPVRLWEKDFKDRYYEVKFGVNKNDIIFRQKVAAAYVEGLCWVLKYYFKDCPSWSWFYPFHYAPFASDFLNIEEIKIDFVKGKPFKPLEQLMAVFPAASKQHLPQPWGELMSNPKSPIIDFYPNDFSIDLNGQKYSWQGVTLLPFIDESRLLEALKSVYTKLTPEEIKRNTLGYARFYFKEDHEIKNFHVSLHEKGSNWKKITIGGISMMKLEKSEDPEELVESVAASGPNVEDEDEPEPPEDFQCSEA